MKSFMLLAWQNPAANRPTFGNTNTSQPLVKFSGDTPAAEKKATFVVLPDFLSTEDREGLVDYYRTRDTSKYSHKDYDGRRYEVNSSKCNVETKGGEVVSTNWISEKGAPMTDAQKAIVGRMITQFMRTIHERIETLPDQLYTLISVPMEYTFKAGEKIAQTLKWHQDSFVKYLGITGVYVDPRIHGAQLELRDLSNRDDVQVQETKPGQIIAFHNIHAEHQVSGAEVDSVDPEVPALRNILTLGVKHTTDKN